MKLLSISIRNLPGLEPGYDLGEEHLASRMRVLYGPNTIGKSSLVRAIRAILWPEEPRMREYLEIAARFEISGVRWSVRREGPSISWLRDGTPVDGGPRLPPFTQACQALVGLHDLAPGKDLGEIQVRIQLQLGGGFNLPRAREGLAPKAREGQRESDALLEAVNKLEAAQLVLDGVRKEEEGLGDLHAELDKGLKAASRLASLAEALLYARARDKHASAELKLQDFPSGMHLLQGREAQDLTELRTRYTEEEANGTNARDELAELQRKATDLGLADPIPAETLDRLQGLLHDLEKAETAVAGASKELAEARGAHDEAAGRFGASANLEDLASLHEGLPSEAERFMCDVHAHECRRREHQAKAGPATAAEAIDLPAQQAIAALAQWLATPDAPPKGRRRFWALLALGGIFVILVIVLAFQHPAWLALLAPGLIAFWFALEPQRTNAPTRADREADFQATAELPPAAWTEVAVRDRLEELHKQIARAEFATLDARRREEHARELEQLEKDESAIRGRREKLVQAVGVPLESPLALFTFSQARAELRGARRELRAKEAALAECAKNSITAIEKLVDELRAVGVEGDLDRASVAPAISSLRVRSTDLRNLRESIKTKEETVSQAEGRAGKAQEAIKRLFDRAGLAVGAEAELHSRLQVRAAWKAAELARNDARAEEAALRVRVSEELSKRSTAEIEAESDRLHPLAGRAKELQKDVTRIETRIDQARGDQAHEEALSEYIDRRAALQSAFATRRHRGFACFLLDEIQAEHERVSKTPLVEKAGRLFAQFTDSRYELRQRTQGGKPVLYVIDHDSTADPLGLEQLSDGTRAQLLLAARLAYLETAEDGDPLPFVLDDALATSDPYRKGLIGKALLETARTQNRQILVLVSDALEVQQLRPKDAGADEFAATDLSELRAAELPVATPPQLRPPAVRRVPEPLGVDPYAYSKVLEAAGMPVAPPDPQRSVEALHPYWVLQHDLPLLFRVLEHRIGTIGAYQNAVRQRILVLDERSEHSIEPWIDFTGSVLDAWKVGRGKPINRQVLIEAGVTKGKIDDVVSLAAELGWDAKALCRALEGLRPENGNRYQKPMLERHQRYLVEHGYLDEADVLTRHEAWMRVLQAGHALPASAMTERFDWLWDAFGAASTEPPPSISALRDPPDGAEPATESP